MRECTGESEAEGVLKEFEKILSNLMHNLSDSNCPFPCERNGFAVALNTLHNNSMIFTQSQPYAEDNYYHISFFYQTLLIEKRVETLGPKL